MQRGSIECVENSIGALRGGGGVGSATKAAIHGWSLDRAADLGPDGIAANVVAPEAHATRVGQTLVQRAGAPEDIAAADRYLASSEDGYVTGQIVQVNGGALLRRG